MPREHGDEGALCELATNGEVGQAGDAEPALGEIADWYRKVNLIT